MILSYLWKPLMLTWQLKHTKSCTCFWLSTTFRYHRIWNVICRNCKSAAGLGAILSKGIGNTLRISLSADPVEEVKVARELLKSFGLASNAATLISCPTCGRIEIDLISIANEVEEYISTLQVPIKVAVLGCAVNGPGKLVKLISVLPARAEKDYYSAKGKSFVKYQKK